MRDLSDNLGAVQALAPAVQAATIDGAAVDLSGFNSVAVIINIGAIVGAGDFTAKLQECDAATSGDFTDVSDDDLIGTLPASLVASSTVRQGYIGAKQFVRVVLTKNSGTSIAAGAVAVLGDPFSRPVA